MEHSEIARRPAPPPPPPTNNRSSAPEPLPQQPVPPQLPAAEQTMSSAAERYDVTEKPRVRTRVPRYDPTEEAAKPQWFSGSKIPPKPTPKARSEAVSATAVIGSFEIRYRQLDIFITDDSCMVLGAANWLCSKGRDDAAEKLVEQLHGRVKMSDMSDLLGPIGAQVVPLKQQDPEKALEEVHVMASRGKDACFLAELVDGNGLAGHTVCLNLGRGVILDPAETHEIALTTQNLDRCTGPYSICVGLKHVHELIIKPLAKPARSPAPGKKALVLVQNRDLYDVVDKLYTVSDTKISEDLDVFYKVTIGTESHYMPRNKLIFCTDEQQLELQKLAVDIDDHAIVQVAESLEQRKAFTRKTELSVQLSSTRQQYEALQSYMDTAGFGMDDVLREAQLAAGAEAVQKVQEDIKMVDCAMQAFIGPQIQKIKQRAARPFFNKVGYLMHKYYKYQGVAAETKAMASAGFPVVCQCSKMFAKTGEIMGEIEEVMTYDYLHSAMQEGLANLCQDVDEFGTNPKKQRTGAECANRQF